MPSPQARNWVFTLNNPTDDEINAINALGTELPEPFRYICFGKEVGEGGTPHLQGFISSKIKKTRNYVKAAVSGRAHLEVAKGSPAQNKTYCSKDGDFYEWGVLPGGAGRRTDLETVAEAIVGGASLVAIAKDHPAAYIRYGPGISRFRMLVKPERSSPPELWLLWGKTGTGKTRRVMEFASEEEMWCSPGKQNQSTWFDGYYGQAAVLFDDFDGSWFQLTYLLKLIDRYVWQVPTKGGFTWWNPKTIYFTSNLKLDEWYSNAHENHRAALARRF